MASSFCPNCGTPRVGGFRFCPSCKLDFDGIDRAAGAGSTTLAPKSDAPVPPQSYSEKYAGTQWAATPAPTTTVDSGSRRSPVSITAFVGLAGIAIVAGLVVVLAAGGVGTGPATPAASPPALASATAVPTAAPTPDSIAAAATRFREIETAYVEAYTARHDKLPASGHFASYAQARNYYRAEVKNLRLFGSRVEGVTFPSELIPDVRALLKRISDLAALMDKLAATKGETAGWKINEKIMTARTAMNAARVVVGKGLGLTYDADLALAPTPKPKATPKPVAKSTPKPVAKATPKPSAKRDYGPTPPNSVTLDGADGVWAAWSGIRSAVKMSRIGTDILAVSDGSGPPGDVGTYHIAEIVYYFRVPSHNLQSVTFQVYSSCPAGHEGAGLGFWEGDDVQTGCKTGWHSYSSDVYDDIWTDNATIAGLVILHGSQLDGIRISKARLVWTSSE